MRIRKLKKEDVKKISVLIRKVLTEINIKDYSKKAVKFLHDYYTPAQITKDATKKLIVVAVEKHKIIGTVNLHENWVGGLFVNPKTHRKGIGRKLMSYVENVAKKREFNSIRLNSSITAFKFYKKIGYTKVKETYVKNIGKTVYMNKRL